MSPNSPHDDADCMTCGEGCGSPNECPKSKRSCGHHCNCVWIHEFCHWCDTEIGDLDQELADLLESEQANAR